MRRLKRDHLRVGKTARQIRTPTYRPTVGQRESHIMWMNRHEVSELQHLDPDTFPVALKGAAILQRLVDWTDSHSDGWSSWPKPGNAASRLMNSLADVRATQYRYPYDTDMTEADLKSGLAPIKSFLTRQINKGHATHLERLEILEGPQAESQHILSVVLVQSEIDALLTLSSNAGLSPSAWIARQISTAVA